jgi:golgin subfamily B member 1
MPEELVDILRRRIEVTLDGEEIIQLHFRRGRVYSDALGDLDAALACYQAVLEQESRNRTALEACERIFFRREEWQRLYEVYEKLVDVAEGDEELAGIYARMARLSSEALDTTDERGEAIELWERVLDIRGEEPEALAALAELYARREKWEELVEIIERQVLVAETDEHRIRLFKRLGRIWSDKLERDSNALDAWLRADEVDPRDLEILRSLAHLYETLQSWDELSNTIRRIIEVGQEQDSITEDEMIGLYAKLGGLEGDILGRVDEAVDAWRRVTALDPGDFRALDALEKLFTREARWEECIDVLEKRALVLDDAEARIDTMLQAAAIWEEKVENLYESAAVYERVRQSDPGNMRAFERL